MTYSFCTVINVSKTGETKEKKVSCESFVKLYIVGEKFKLSEDLGSEFSLEYSAFIIMSSRVR